MSKKKPQRSRFSSSERTLDLAGKNLEMVPYSFGSNRLETLNLARNRIRTLPKKTTHLTSLDLSNNELSEIPAEVKKRLLSYKKLETLNLEENGLEEWPKELDKMKGLRHLKLFANDLRRISVNCKHIHVIELGQNRLTEMPVVPPGITRLLLDYNKISKVNLVAEHLKRLTLNMNGVSELGPDFSFPALKFLDLGRNHLTTLPDLSVATPSLSIFECADNYLTEWPTMPPTLSVVSFKGNKLRVLPDVASLYPELTILEVGQNEIEEIPPLPEGLLSLGVLDNKVKSSWSGKLGSLKKMVISGNQLETIPVFEDHIIEELCVCNNMLRRVNIEALTVTIEKLNLSDNKIKKIPKELFTLPALNTLILVRNRIKSIPIEWTRCKGLSVFCIAMNPLEKLPNEFPQFLRTLNVAYCNLTELPEGISKCCFLEELVASGNLFTSIPKLAAIVTLILSRNKLTEIPQCPKTLACLDCSHNFITSIPEDINYPKLIDLDLSHNDIEFVPGKLGIPLVKYFKVSYNPRIVETIKTRQYPSLLILNIEGTQMRFVKIPAVREVMTSQASLFINPYVKLIRGSEGVGYSEMCGIRESMEDAIVIREDVKDDISLYSVIDGHGGTKTSTISAYKLARYAMENAELTDEFAQATIKELNSAIEKCPDGATIVMALRQRNQLMTCHLGDARAVIIRNDGSVKFETDDHKPFKRKEYERIRDMGSRVVAGRTHGILAVSRSLGDFRIPGVSYEPEISHLEIAPEDKWLVLACDGVWDVITSELLGQICKDATDPAHLAVDIKNMAYASGGMDNISVICVDLTCKAAPAAPHSVVPEDRMETDMEVPMESCYMREQVQRSFHNIPVDLVEEVLTNAGGDQKPSELPDFSMLIPEEDLANITSELAQAPQTAAEQASSAQEEKPADEESKSASNKQEEEASENEEQTSSEQEDEGSDSEGSSDESSEDSEDDSSEDSDSESEGSEDSESSQETSEQEEDNSESSSSQSDQ